MSRGKVTRHFGKTRGQKNQVWGAVLVNGSTVDETTPPFDFNIVEGGDWSGAAGSERATLMRIRGWLTLVPPASVPSTLFVIVTKDEVGVGAAGNDPTVAATYGTEDVLWTYGISVAATVANDLMVLPVNIDIKAMRRITNGDQIRMTMRTSGPIGASWTISGAIRSLIRKSS